MLNSAANHVASLLLKLVSHDTIAAGRCIAPVYMSTSPELYISYLAILKGGLAFSPLPMDAPLERIRELIQDIMPPVVLGIGGKPDEWASQGIQTTWIDITEISRWKTLSNQDMSGEIESVLSTVPGVIELVAAITTVSDAREGSEQIVACIVANTQSSDERQRLVDTCCHNSDKFLPAYMRPPRYIFLDSLPRSSSGKVNRKKVHSEILASGIDQSFSSSSETHCLPTTMDELDPQCDSLQSSTQTLLMVAIGEAVGEPSSAISPETSLASVGLDSLGAVRLLQKLRDHSINAEVGDVLQSGTIKGLVAKVALASQPRNLDSKSVVYEPQLHKVLGSFAERNLSSCAERLGVREDQIQTVLPTTATQSGMLASFLRSSNKTIGSTPAYVYHPVMPIRDGIDIGELKQAWDTVMSSYDSFRTVFCHLDDDMSPFAQCILKPRDEFVKPAWSTYSVGLGHRDYNATVERACRNAETQIDIGTNASHISLVSSETQSTVVLSMFHGISDGGSLQILLQDVTEAYAGRPVRERTSLEHIVHHHYSADPEAIAWF
ncbi:hypothetical protein BFJ69_g16430 [Fusarium oxysporum]|uniref:Carrier domain-containing protein n=1 Tax=Fusarium oxysporum TaxID=5507 RepID=A0A420MB92_FUSOX|nr:hypothetical protein BFJ69_g16430 [Fusarium oxysporum]